MTEIHAKAWYQRYSNYWRLKSSVFDRSEAAFLVKDCLKTEQLFRAAFHNVRNKKGELLHNFKNVNHHIHAFHWVPIMLFNGPSLYISTQKFERFYQVIKGLAENTNQHDLFYDIMTGVFNQFLNFFFLFFFILTNCWHSTTGG